TREVRPASAESAVNDSNVISSVGRGMVWKWSNSQIDSKPSRSACCATAAVRRQASTESQPSYSPCQPCGTTTPTFKPGLLSSDRCVGLLAGQRPRRVGQDLVMPHSAGGDSARIASRNRVPDVAPGRLLDGIPGRPRRNRQEA